MQSVASNGETFTHVEAPFIECMDYMLNCRLANSPVNFTSREKYATPAGWGPVAYLRVISAEDETLLVYEDTSKMDLVGGKAS